MSVNPDTLYARKLIQRWIGAKQTGDLNDPDTVAELLKDVTGLREYLADKETKKPTSKPSKKLKPISGKIDSRSLKNIQTLHEKIRPMFIQIVLIGKRIARENGAGDYMMTGGSRTYSEQNKLYAQGRTRSGNRVTNARGGYSNHNFGVAGDMGVFGKSGKYLDSSNPALADKIHKLTAAAVKKRFPKLEWGGDWKSFKDYPHFQYATGYSMSQMRTRTKNGLAVV